MNLSFRIALKYFYSKNIRNEVHIISRISQLGILVGTFALVVVLCVFNGLEDTVISLYSSFDPDLKVTPATGKYFQPDSLQLLKLQKDTKVRGFTEVIEEVALIKYKSNKTIVTLKGIEPAYLANTGIDTTKVKYGKPILKQDDVNYIILGSGIASKLDLNLDDFDNFLQVYFPKRGNSNYFFLHPDDAFNEKVITPAGVFSIQQDFDVKYAIVPLDFMRDLVGERKKMTSLEIALKPGTDIQSFKSHLKKSLGQNYIVQDQKEQHKLFYKITRSEKLVMFLILSLIILIAGFNLIGSLLMLSIEKKRDMMILKSMGADSGLIRKIFFLEGIMLSLSGAVVGIFLGALVCWLQQKFGFVKFASGSTFVRDSYPVSFRAMDFVWVFITVGILGFISSYLPARIAFKEITILDIKN